MIKLEEKLRIKNLDAKANFILEWYLDQEQETDKIIDIEKFVYDMSENDEDFYNWLLDVDNLTQSEQILFDNLTRSEKGVFVIYLQKATKLLWIKNKKRRK